MYCLEDAFCNQSEKHRWSVATEYYSVAVCFGWSLSQCYLQNIFSEQTAFHDLIIHLFENQRGKTSKQASKQAKHPK